MKIFGFFKPHRKMVNDEKIFIRLKSMLKPFPRHFREDENAEIRQAYIGGEDFGLHRAGDKHIILVCNVQRCPQRMYCFDGRRNIRTATVIPIHTVQQKRY